MTDGQGVRVASDIGGTFTDVAVFDPADGRLRLGKTLSTPAALVDGVSNGLEKAGAKLADTGLFIHGTTVVINTLLERSGARTALICTEGFRDSYEMGRGNRPDAYNLFFKKHAPLVERALRFTVRERILASGEVLTALDEESVARVCGRLSEEKVEAVGILLLHSYRNPAHEIRVKQLVQQRLPGIFVSASHELSQEYREFERGSTVAANAYVGPRVHEYLKGIAAHLVAERCSAPFLVVQSSGGLMAAGQARRHCVKLLESGPAGGIVGVGALCNALAIDDAIGIDMGGTTAKAGVIHQGKPLTTGKAMVGGYFRGLPIQTSMIDIFEVGTGGGSIAAAGPSDSMRVGPRSAGAVPGPACYGLGGREPTVTDANLMLGRLDASRFLGGEMPLDPAAAQAAIKEHLADPLGMTATEAASGILRIATNSMANAVRTIATSRGLDAAAFVLVAYGGAGPLHASGVMRELGMRSLIIPRAPGHFSAFGMLFADLRVDSVRTRIVALDTVSFGELEQIFSEEEARGGEALRHAQAFTAGTAIQRALEMRYVGQEHSVSVDIPVELFQREDRAGIKQRFDAQHAIRYGRSAPAEKAEIVNLRVGVIGRLPAPSLERVSRAADPSAHAALAGTRAVHFAELEKFVETTVYSRDLLRAGHRIIGPALVEEYASTTVVLPRDELLVDDFGNLVIANSTIANSTIANSTIANSTFEKSTSEKSTIAKPGSGAPHG